MLRLNLSANTSGIFASLSYIVLLMTRNAFVKYNVYIIKRDNNIGEYFIKILLI